MSLTPALLVYLENLSHWIYIFTGQPAGVIVFLIDSYIHRSSGCLHIMQERRDVELKISVALKPKVLYPGHWTQITDDSSLFQLVVFSHRIFLVFFITRGIQALSTCPSWT